MGDGSLKFDMADSACGQGILRCKCRFVNWKYLTVGVWEVII